MSTTGPWHAQQRFTKWCVRRRATNGFQMHVGRSIRVGGPGRIILFSTADSAEARAAELNSRPTSR